MNASVTAQTSASDGTSALAVVSAPTEKQLMAPVLLLAGLMVLAFGWFSWTHETLNGAMNAWAVSGPRLLAGEYQTILLHMFAHGGPVHIIFNLMTLGMIGPWVIERLGPPSARSLVGFVALYLATGLAGMAVWLAINPMSEVTMLGASGAIFGFLAVILRRPNAVAAPVALTRRAMADFSLTFLKVHVPLALMSGVPLLFGASFFILAWEAHLGGFVAGLLLIGPMSRWCAQSEPDAAGSTA